MKNLSYIMYFLICALLIYFLTANDIYILYIGSLGAFESKLISGVLYFAIAVLFYCKNLKFRKEKSKP